ncbi:MAG: hypothetical protein K0U20_09385 [Proteobacteria bacterium]|nr:hypothetical protein [Pseudomonadota bacterium]MCH9735793.1 hypothetical protein [Actinomycetes bacterium]
MATVPEFISLLRDIRDRIYPSVNQSEQVVADAEANVIAIEDNVELIQADVTEKNQEIKNISVVNPVTTVPNLPNGNAGSADVIYSGVNNQFTFSVPVGPKGDSQRIDFTVDTPPDLLNLTANTGDIAFVNSNSSQYVKLDTGNNTDVATDWSTPIVVTPTTEFIALTDTPSGYTGQAKKIPVVSDAEGSLIFKTSAEIGVVGYNYVDNPLFENPLSEQKVITNVSFGSENRGYGTFTQHVGTPTLQSDSVRISNGVTITNPNASVSKESMIALDFQLESGFATNSTLLTTGNITIRISGTGGLSVDDGTTATEMPSFTPVTTSRYNIIVTEEDFIVIDSTLGTMTSTASGLAIQEQTNGVVTLGGSGMVCKYYGVSVSDRQGYLRVENGEEEIAEGWSKVQAGADLTTFPNISGSRKGMYFIAGGLQTESKVRMKVGDGAGFSGREVTFSFNANSLGVGSNAVTATFVTDRGSEITTNRLISQSLGTLILEDKVDKEYSLTFTVNAFPQDTFIDRDGRDYIEFTLPSSANFSIEVSEPKLELGQVGTTFTPQGGSGSGEGTPSIGKESGRMLGLRDDSVEWTPFNTTPNTIKEDYTIPTNSSASIVSPTIEDGVNVTIPEGSKLVIL